MTWGGMVAWQIKLWFKRCILSQVHQQHKGWSMPEHDRTTHTIDQEWIGDITLHNQLVSVWQLTRLKGRHFERWHHDSDVWPVTYKQKSAKSVTATTSNHQISRRYQTKTTFNLATLNTLTGQKKKGLIEQANSKTNCWNKSPKYCKMLFVCCCLFVSYLFRVGHSTDMKIIKIVEQQFTRVKLYRTYMSNKVDPSPTWWWCRFYNPGPTVFAGSSWTEGNIRSRKHHSNHNKKKL